MKIVLDGFFGIILVVVALLSQPINIFSVAFGIVGGGLIVSHRNYKMITIEYKKAKK